MAEKKSAEWYAATRVWWAALLETAGGDRKLVLKWVRDAARRQQGWDGNPVTDKMLSNYLRRGGRPNPTELRLATEQVMRERVPSPPAGVPPKWHDLNHLMYPDAAETGPEEPKRAPVRVAALDKALLDDPDFTVDEATSLEGLRRWFQQGSWVTDNRTPPYVPRIGNAVDQRLRERLQAATERPATAEGPSGRGGLVVVTGPPKAGKTRTLLEALRNTRPEAKLWRITAAPGALEAVLKSVSADGGHPADHDPAEVVVLLDDLQRYDFSTTDVVTDKLLNRLLNTGVTIAATVHSSFLTELTRFQHDHRRSPDDLRVGIGASAALVAMLTDPDVLTTIDPVLTADELDNMDPELINHAAGHDIDQDRFARLPELLAAVDALKARADEGLNDADHPERASILQAAVDATFLYPAGAARAELEQLTRWAHHHHWPTLTWAPEDFTKALKWATDPLGGKGSTHAIILPAERTHLALFDPLLAHLQTTPWNPNHINPYSDQLDPTAQTKIGDHLYATDNPAAAQHWWTKAAEAGDTGAMNSLGMAFYRADELDEAKYWWAKGAAASSGIVFENNLGNLHREAGELEEAKYWYGRSAIKGNNAARYYLGAIHHGVAERFLAEHWWTLAAEDGDRWAMHDLGRLYEEAQKLDKAEYWWTRAAHKGHADSTRALVALLERAGRDEEAEDWRKSFPSGGDQREMSMHFVVTLNSPDVEVEGLIEMLRSLSDQLGVDVQVTFEGEPPQLNDPGSCS